MVPPPQAVSGIGLFPVLLPHVHPELGPFPSPEDAEDYEGQVRVSAVETQPAATPVRAPRRITGRSLADVRVFVSAPVWSANGVSAWSEDLVRGLRQSGVDARVLLTEESTRLVRIDEPRRPRPSDLPFEELHLAGNDNWGARWGAMIRTLEAAAPCIYFPTYDWRHSCVVPALSNRVVVVGTFHDLEGLYTEHAARLGAFWNGVVATSRPIERHILRRLPELVPRLATIPHAKRMIRRYLDLFCRVIDDAASGRFRRPPGQVLPPPSHVDGQSVFPVELACASEFGTFPGPSDVRRFREESARLLPRRRWSWR